MRVMPLRWTIGTVAAAVAALAASTATARSVPLPRFAIDTGAVTDLAVGETVALSVRDMNGKPAAGAATWSVEPPDIARRSEGGVLEALAPGRVRLSVRISGEADPTPLDLWVHASLPGGRLPSLEGASAPARWSVDSTSIGGRPWLVFHAEIDRHVLFFRAGPLESGSLPATLPLDGARYAPVADAATGRWPPASGTVRLDSYRRGVLSGAIDLDAGAGRRLRLGFRTGVHLGAYLAHVAVDSKVLLPSDEGGGLRGVLLLPRGEAPKSGLVLLPDALGLDAGVLRCASEWATEGHAVVAVDPYGGRVSTRLEVTSDGAEPRVDEAALDRALARAVSLAGGAGADGLPTRPVGVLGWGPGADRALRLARASPRVAAAVLFFGGRAEDLAALPALDKPVFAVLGRHGPGPGARAVDALAAGLWSAPDRHEVRIVDGRADGLTSPYWSFGSGTAAGQVLIGRARAFVSRVLP